MDDIGRSSNPPGTEDPSPAHFTNKVPSRHSWLETDVLDAFWALGGEGPLSPFDGLSFYGP